VKTRISIAKIAPGALALLLALSLPSSSRAQEVRFFRITGPVATTITALTADGVFTWTNAATNATFTIQTAASLLGQTNWFDYIKAPATNTITTLRLYDPNAPSGMTLIPAGLFQMGDSLNDSTDQWGERPVHTVYVSAFYMDRCPVTKELWDEVYQWAKDHGYSFQFKGSASAASHPVQCMSWCDAVIWCNARSEKEGRIPAYYTNAALTAVYRSGYVSISNSWVKWNAGYRLPTEAEWEKAARGGASGRRFSWADADTITHSRANYRSGASYTYDVSPTRGLHPAFNGPSPVGSFAPNSYGLYDMTGSTMQWCWDAYGPYSPGSQTDPRGPNPSAHRRLRGAGCFFNAFECRVAFRSYFLASSSDPNYGFRSALPSNQP
jgi:formylglycine-generating enzyme required for sulfatase activity